MVDSETGRPKGYGFIRYTDMGTFIYLCTPLFESRVIDNVSNRCFGSAEPERLRNRNSEITRGLFEQQSRRRR